MCRCPRLLQYKKGDKRGRQKTLEQFIPPTPSATEDRGEVASTKSVRQTERAQVFVVEATDGSPSSVNCQGDQDIGPDFTREGSFDVSEVEPDLASPPWS